MALICRLTHHQPTRQLVRVSWRSVIGLEPDAVKDGDAYRWATFCSRCRTWLEVPDGAEVPSLGTGRPQAPLTVAGLAIGAAGCLIVAVGFAYEQHLALALVAPIAWGVFLLYAVRSSRRREIGGLAGESLPHDVTPSSQNTAEPRRS